MARLNIAQTLTAKAAPQFTPAFPPAFPFLSPSAALPMRVPALATSGSVITLVLDLSGYIPAESIAIARVWMLEAGGVDAWPVTRLLGGHTIPDQPRRTIKQNLVSLVPNGRYVALAQIRTPAGRAMSFTAPFVATPSPVGRYLLWDIPGYPPYIMTDDDGVPLTPD